MSYDDNNLNNRNSHTFFDAIYRDKRKLTHKNNHPKFQTRQSKINNKMENTLFIQRRKKKQLTIGPLSSTLESSISSSKKQIDDDSTISSEKIIIKSKKLVQPTDEDMKFLFDIFFKKNQYQFNNKYNNNIRKSN